MGATGYSIGGSPWNRAEPVGYESAGLAEQRLSVSGAQAAHITGAALQGASITKDSRSEVERALDEQAEVIDRLGQLVGMLSSRLAPVLFDGPATGAMEREPEREVWTPVARSVNARTTSLRALGWQLDGLIGRLGI